MERAALDRSSHPWPARALCPSQVQCCLLQPSQSLCSRPCCSQMDRPPPALAAVQPWPLPSTQCSGRTTPESRCYLRSTLPVDRPARVTSQSARLLHIGSPGLQCATPWPVSIRNKSCPAKPSNRCLSLFIRSPAYSATPHENTAKPACTRCRASSRALARWTTRGSARSNQSLPIRPACMPREEVCLRCRCMPTYSHPHASASPASSRIPREHHKLSLSLPHSSHRSPRPSPADPFVFSSSPLVSLRACDCDLPAHFSCPPSEPGHGTRLTASQALGSTSPHRCNLSPSWPGLCSEPAPLDGWREACQSRQGACGPTPVCILLLFQV